MDERKEVRSEIHGGLQHLIPILLSFSLFIYFFNFILILSFISFFFDAITTQFATGSSIVCMRHEDTKMDAMGLISCAHG